MEYIGAIGAILSIFLTLGLALFHSPKEKLAELEREIENARARHDELSRAFWNTQGKHDTAIANLDSRILGLTTAVERLTERINQFLSKGNGHGGRA